MRFYLLGINELDTLSNKDLVAEGQQFEVLIAVFAYLFFGQIIDNRPWSKQKQIFCLIEFFLCLWLGVLAWAAFIDSDNLKSNSEQYN